MHLTGKSNHNQEAIRNIGFFGEREKKLSSFYFSLFDIPRFLYTWSVKIKYFSTQKISEMLLQDVSMQKNAIFVLSAEKPFSFKMENCFQLRYIFHFKNTRTKNHNLTFDLKFIISIYFTNTVINHKLNFRFLL